MNNDDIIADGNNELADFLVQNFGLSNEMVMEAVGKVRLDNLTLSTDGLSSGIASCLLDAIAHTEVVSMETLQEKLLEACKYPYVPLSIFDADISIVKKLPHSLTMERLIVPFDASQSKIMLALVNPFDETGKKLAADVLEAAMPSYEIIWYLTDPAGITRLLRNAYHLN